MTDLVPVDPSTPAVRAETVSPETARRIAAGVPRNTRKAYGTVRALFETWCENNNRTPYPTTAVTLADYMSHLCDLGRKPSTLGHHLGAISALNQASGHPPLSKDITQAARLVIRGLQREYAKSGVRQKKAPPITRDRLRMMSGACDQATLAGKRDRLLLVLGWALAGRRSELAGLCIEDVTETNDGGLEILIRTSKTDKDSAGWVAGVPAGEHVNTDPVGLLHDWLDALAERGVDTRRGPLLRAVTKGDRLYKAHRDLSAHAINMIVKRAAHRAGLPQSHLYSGHSLRSGFATQATEDGIPLTHWAEHGRWSPTSPVALGYVRASDRKANNPLKRMGL